MNILFVEDDDLCRELGLRVFSLFPALKVFAAENGQEALKHHQDRSYDLIVLDLELPDTDGNVLAKDLREQKETMPPIIAISAHMYPDSDTPSNVDKLYLKPLTYDKLTEMIVIAEAV